MAWDGALWLLYIPAIDVTIAVTLLLHMRQKCNTPQVFLLSRCRRLLDPLMNPPREMDVVHFWRFRWRATSSAADPVQLSAEQLTNILNHSVRQVSNWKNGRVTGSVRYIDGDPIRFDLLVTPYHFPADEGKRGWQTMILYPWKRHGAYSSGDDATRSDVIWEAKPRLFLNGLMPSITSSTSELCMPPLPPARVPNGRQNPVPRNTVLYAVDIIYSRAVWQERWWAHLVRFFYLSLSLSLGRTSACFTRNGWRLGRPVSQYSVL